VLGPLVRAGLVHPAEVRECSGVFPKTDRVRYLGILFGDRVEG